MSFLFSNRSVKYLAYTFSLVFVVYMVIFFQTDLTDNRVFQQLWNSGHIILFMVYSLLILKHVNRSAKQISYLKLFVFIVLSSLLLGVLIEILQSFTGRDKSMYDVQLDLVGAVSGFVVFSKLKQVCSRFVYNAVIFSVALFSLVSVAPLVLNIVDSFYQQEDFPLLLSNKHTTEFTRFGLTNSNISSVNSKTESPGQVSILKVNFIKSDDSAVTLFVPNISWADYSHIQFEILNPSDKTFILNFKINQKINNKTLPHFQSSLNYALNLKPGWNNFSIKFSDMHMDSHNDKFDFNRVRSLMFFILNLQQDKTVFISRIRLDK